MKKLFTLAVLLLATATTASAQFATGGGSKSSRSANRSTGNEDWNRIFVSYNPISIKNHPYDLNGISAGYSHGFSIARNIPLYLEVAPQLTYSFGNGAEIGDNIYKYLNDIYSFDDDFDDDAESASFSYLAVNVPINVAYKFSFQNIDLSIVPYLGLNLRGNIIAQSSISGSSEKYDYFSDKDRNDDDDESNSDYTWRRFQLGGQIGIGVNYKHLYAGVGYGFDFTEICKGTKSKVSIVNITIGYNF